MAKNNPVLASALVEQRSEGKIEGKIETLLRILEVRGVTLSGEERERVVATRDAAQVDAWLDRAVVCRDAAELFE